MARKDAKAQRKEEYRGMGMTENDLARVVVDAALMVHREFGCGILESVYEAVLAAELQQRGLFVERQVYLPVKWRHLSFENAFRVDLLVDKKLIVEIKSVEILAPVYARQLLTYLRLSRIKLGLLINFGEPLIKNGIKRVINGLGLEKAA